MHDPSGIVCCCISSGIIRQYRAAPGASQDVDEHAV